MLAVLVTVAVAPATAAPASVEVRVRWSPDPAVVDPPPLPDALVWADCDAITPVPREVTLTVGPGGISPAVVAVTPGGRVSVSNIATAKVAIRATRGRVSIMSGDVAPGDVVRSEALRATDRPIEVVATMPGVPTLTAVVRVLDRASGRTGADGSVPLRLAAGTLAVTLFHPLVGELRWADITVAPREVAVLELVGHGDAWEATVRRRERVVAPSLRQAVLLGRVTCAGPCEGVSLGAESGVPGAMVFAGSGPLAPVAPLAMTDADGSFRIEGLPAGPISLTVWHATLGEHSEEARLAAGAVTVSTYVFHGE